MVTIALAGSVITIFYCQTCLVRIYYFKTKFIKMSSSDDCSDIENAWEIGCASIIPEKSKDRYKKAYTTFKTWFEEKHGKNISEKVVLAYFVQRSKILLSPGSLWAEYSMLKATIFLNDSIDISKFSMLIAFLKRKNVGHKTKKASVFTKEDMTKFLMEAPNDIYLIHKVIITIFTGIKIYLI